MKWRFLILNAFRIFVTNINKPLILWSSVSTNDTTSFHEFSWKLYELKFKLPISAEMKKPLYFDGFFYLNFYVN